MKKSNTANSLDTPPDIHSEASRKKMAKLIINLFEKWDLDTATQLNLLGLSPTSRSLLSQYRSGSKAISNTRDQFDRMGWLLSIHKSLRLLYPQNENLRYHWIKYKNLAFNNLTPLELMTGEGIIGLAKVARYLDFRCGR